MQLITAMEGGRRKRLETRKGVSRWFVSMPWIGTNEECRRLEILFVTHSSCLTTVMISRDLCYKINGVNLYKYKLAHLASYA